LGRDRTRGSVGGHDAAVLGADQQQAIANPRDCASTSIPSLPRKLSRSNFIVQRPSEVCPRLFSAIALSVADAISPP